MNCIFYNLYNFNKNINKRKLPSGSIRLQRTNKRNNKNIKI